MSTVEKWFPYRKGADGFELFAFPHVGAGSTVFNFLRKALDHNGVALSAAVLPGHGRRLRETPHQSMDTLLAEFEDMAQRDAYSAFMADYGLLGHCSGSLVAYEIAKLLVRSPCRNPQLLVVCSCLPPPLIHDTGMSRLSTEELFSQTASMGGTPEALMEDRDFLEVLERPLRADWVIVDGYVYRASAELPVPILAVRGAEDPDIQAGDLRLWQDQTSEMFLTADLESGHWALTEAGSSALAREIPAALSAIRSA
jgi:surfactin synthase thioesterase subunit